MNKIPRESKDCALCFKYGDCADHRGPDGSRVPYAGPDVYEPSDWVLGVVGQRYHGGDQVYACTGYDPRAGFWMRGEGDGRITNVSERAIGRTFNRCWAPSHCERCKD